MILNYQKINQMILNFQVVTGIEDLILLFMEQNYQLNVDQSIFSVYSIF